MTEQELAAVVKVLAPVIREAIAAGVKDYTSRLVALETKEFPVVRDGAPGPPGEKGVDGAPGERGPEGPPGPARDGIDGTPGAPGPIGEKGADGAVGERGPAGPEGTPGRDGRDGLPGVPGLPGEKGLDGLHGKDGLDGLGFDDFDEVFDGERTFTRRYIKGDRVKEFVFTVPFVLDLGVHHPGRKYVKGDAVTYAGSFWIAQQETIATPGGASPESRGQWRLAVKAGRDGKNGVDAPSAAVVRVR